MDRYTVLLDWKNPYCENSCTAQDNLQIQCSLYQNTRFFSTELKQSILQFVWKHKSLQIAKAIVRKKSRAKINRLPVFRLYYKATVIKNVW